MVFARGNCELGSNGVFGLGEGVNGDCIPGLPESTYVAGYVAGDAEVWGLGRLVKFIGLFVGSFLIVFSVSSIRRQAMETFKI